MPMSDKDSDPMAPLVGPGGKLIPGWRSVSTSRSRALRDIRSDDLQALQIATRLFLQEAETEPTDRFLIIERTDQHYMQCLCHHSGWLLEKREGDEAHHFRALVINDEDADVDGESLVAKLFQSAPQPRPYLDMNQIYEAMTSFLFCEPEPEWLGWERVKV